MDYDIRTKPYWVYDRFDFDVPIGEHGDNYDRYLMRVEELRQSDSILRQALKSIPPGPVIDDWRIALPPKPEVYGTIEGVMSHFKLVMEGIPVPPGEIYDATDLQRRARLVHRERRARPSLQAARARPGFPILSAVPTSSRARCSRTSFPPLTRST